MRLVELDLLDGDDVHDAIGEPGCLEQLLRLLLAAIRQRADEHAARVEQLDRGDRLVVGGKLLQEREHLIGVGAQAVSRDRRLQRRRRDVGERLEPSGERERRRRVEQPLEPGVEPGAAEPSLQRRDVEKRPDDVEEDRAPHRATVPVATLASLEKVFVVDGLENAFRMAWEVWWALVLGFTLSGIVQAWVPRARLERALGGRGVRQVALSAGMGAASSSCSYAAVAIAKSLFQKGASFASAMVFQFASTNLVFEIGIVMWIFLGWQFTLAEFVGGIVLIALMWLGVRLFVTRKVEEEARRHAEAAQAGHQHGSSGSGAEVLVARALAAGAPQLPRGGGDVLEEELP